MMIWAKKSPHFREKYLVPSYLKKSATTTEEAHSSSKRLEENIPELFSVLY